jgi:hypothetical protein
MVSDISFNVILKTRRRTGTGVKKRALRNFPQYAYRYRIKEMKNNFIIPDRHIYCKNITVYNNSLHHNVIVTEHNRDNCAAKMVTVKHFSIPCAMV